MARIFLSPPHLSGRERELVAEALDSNWIAPLGPQVDAFEAELAAVAGVPHARRALERHRGAPPRARRARDRRRRRGRVLRVHVRRERERDHLHGRDAVLRRLRRGDLDARPRPARARRSSSDARPARASAPSSRSTSTASAATTTRSASCASGTTSCSCRTRPSRSARPTAARRPAARARSRRSPSTGTRSSRRAAAGCSSRRTASWVEHARKLSTQAREPVAALRAPRDRLQLPAQQPARGARPRTARDAPRPRRGAAADPRPLPRAARRAGHRVHARGGLRHDERAG